MAVSAVAVKLPEFWQEDPTTWFIEAESQFALAGVVTDSTKYHHIVKNITSKTKINAVWDIISAPPAENKYETIKTRLLKVFDDSLQVRVEKLFNAEIGEMKPSQFLSYLRRLAANTGINDESLKAIFLKGLPAHMSSILSILTNPLTAIAEFGDVMIKREPQVNQINHSDEKYNELKQEIEHLTAAVRNMRSGAQPRSNNHQSNRANNSDICWYHMKYGRNARKCSSPCRFQNN